MCGRYTLQQDAAQIESRFSLPPQKLPLSPNYNASPGTALPVICNQPADKLVLMHWGFIPNWSLSANAGNRPINARIETVATQPIFREAFQHRRCLVLADGYYEWKSNGKEKIPHYITPASGGLFAMAGLWESWQAEGQSEVLSFAILTAEASGNLRNIHDRIPLVLHKEDEKKWLDNQYFTKENVDKLRPMPGTAFRFHTVSKEINHVKHNHADLTKPFFYPVQTKLF